MSKLVVVLIAFASVLSFLLTPPVANAAPCRDKFGQRGHFWGGGKRTSPKLQKSDWPRWRGLSRGREWFRAIFLPSQKFSRRSNGKESSLSSSQRGELACNCGRNLSEASFHLAKRSQIIGSHFEFIDENGGGPSVLLRERKTLRSYRYLYKSAANFCSWWSTRLPGQT
jgi:hypothetical protein